MPQGLPRAPGKGKAAVCVSRDNLESETPGKVFTLIQYDPTVTGAGIQFQNYHPEPDPATPDATISLTPFPATRGAQVRRAPFVDSAGPQPVGQYFSFAVRPQPAPRLKKPVVPLSKKQKSDTPAPKPGQRKQNQTRAGAGEAAPDAPDAPVDHFLASARGEEVYGRTPRDMGGVQAVQDGAPPPALPPPPAGVRIQRHPSHTTAHEGHMHLMGPGCAPPPHPVAATGARAPHPADQPPRKHARPEGEQPSARPRYLMDQVLDRRSPPSPPAPLKKQTPEPAAPKRSMVQDRARQTRAPPMHTDRAGPAPAPLPYRPLASPASDYGLQSAQWGVAPMRPAWTKSTAITASSARSHSYDGADDFALDDADANYRSTRAASYEASLSPELPWFPTPSPVPSVPMWGSSSLSGPSSSSSSSSSSAASWAPVWPGWSPSPEPPTPGTSVCAVMDWDTCSPGRSRALSLLPPLPSTPSDDTVPAPPAGPSRSFWDVVMR